MDLRQTPRDLHHPTRLQAYAYLTGADVFSLHAFAVAWAAQGVAGSRSMDDYGSMWQTMSRGGGGIINGFKTPTETNVHGDALRFMVMGPSVPH